jgi:glycine cleavage system H protein
MNIPSELKYTKEHEWIRVDKEGVVEIGVTDYAQGELGDVIFVEINYSLGGQVAKGEVIGTIEAVKTVAEIFSPVTGTIYEINIGINDNPSDANVDPYGKGWLIKIRPESPAELDELLDADAYKKLIGE